MADQLSRFIFNSLPIRGEHVQLTKTWQEIIKRRAYPEAVGILLGELVAASALLGATIKIDGRMTVQIQATGKVSLMVVQIDNHGALRALAKHKDINDEQGLLALCEKGQLIITIESPNYKEPYQGVIPLIDGSIAQALERYFETSEQLTSRIYLNANTSSVAGFFLQKLPNNGEENDGFEHISILADTIKPEELQNVSTVDLLHHLYHEEDIKLFEADNIYFKCQCSHEKTKAMLLHFDESELFAMLAENNGVISVACEFCGQSYHMDEIDIKTLRQANISDTFH